MNSYEILNQELKKAMEKDFDWSRPWEIFRNVSYDGRPYCIQNNLLLYAHTLDLDLSETEYKPPIWITPKKCQQIGAKWQGKTCPIFFFTVYSKGTGEINSKGEERVQRIPIFRYYRVVHLAQTDIPTPEEYIGSPEGIESLAEADKIIQGYKDMPEIKNGGERAYYSIHEDYIGMPAKSTFKNTEGYYQVLFHEMVHSTGSESRLGRFSRALFSDTERPCEELCAEVGSAYLCAKAGLPFNEQQHGAYLKSWIGQVIDEKERALAYAFSAAEKAVKYIEKGEKPNDTGNDS